MRVIKTLLVVLAIFTFAFPAIAQTTVGSTRVSGGAFPDFTFQIPIGDLKKITLCATDADGKLKCEGIGRYIAAIYQWLVGFAAVLAVLAVTWGGVQWLISRGESGKIEEARKIIGSAVIGLVLALGSYLLLTTIREDYVTFRPIRIEPIKEISLTMNADAAGISKARTVAESRHGALTPSASGPMPSSATDFPNIKWLDLPKNWSASTEFGETYTDILSRAVISEAEWYKKGGLQEGTRKNRILDAHEYAHYTPPWYVGNGKGFKVKIPTKIKNSDLAAAVPKSLRAGGLEYSHGTIYESYLVKIDPLEMVPGTILAELVARNAASKVGVEMHKMKLLDKILYDPPEKSYSIAEQASAMENTSFIVFALALAQTIEEKDKDFLTQEKQFKDALQFLIEDGRKVAKELEKIYTPSEQAILKGLQKNPDAKALRDIAKKWYGPTWTQKWLGF
ncbi:MAG: pilin [Patescibacteria group bacterium]